MEVPEPLLFSQMLQMYPNVPRDIVQVYTIQYANDAELCSRMLDLQKNMYARSVNNSNAYEPSIKDQLRELQLNHHAPVINSSIEDSTNFNQSLELQCQNLLRPSIQEASNYDFYHDANLQNVSDSPNVVQELFSDDNSKNKFHNTHIQAGEMNINSHPETSSSDVLDQQKDSLLSENVNLDANYYIPSLMENHVKSFESQLHIDIESEDDNMHSWRPSLPSYSSDCSFFLPHLLSDSKTSFNLPAKPTSELQRNCNVLQTVNEVASSSSLSPSDIWKEADISTDKSQIHFLLPDPSCKSGISIDLQNHLQSQKMQLNNLKFELGRSKTESYKLKEEINQLEQELAEKSYFEDDIEIKKLKEENAKLRNECQCLCIEVDHYLKGAAPLGEVSEEFYKGSSLSFSKQDEGSTKKTQPPPRQDTDEDDESNIWECSVCTFANHPEINSCEICHLPRQTLGNARHISSSNASCYCHRNKGPFSISS